MKKENYRPKPVEVWTEADEAAWIKRLEEMANFALDHFNNTTIPTLEISRTDYGIYSIDIEDTDISLVPDLSLEELEERIWQLLQKVEIEHLQHTEYLNRKKEDYERTIARFKPVRKPEDISWETHIGIIKAAGATLEMIPTREEYAQGYKFAVDYVAGMTPEVSAQMEKHLGKDWFRREVSNESGNLF